MKMTKIASSEERKEKREKMRIKNTFDKKILSKENKLLKEQKLLDKRNTISEVKKSIRMKQDVASKLKIASTLLDMTQGELIEKMLSQYIDIDQVYEKELKPLLKKINSKKIKLIDF